MDKATDAAVIYQFYIFGTKELNQKTVECEHMNVFYLFLFSVGVLLLYHLASSSLIWYYTGNWKRFFTQMLDLELLYALYINYILQKEVKYPSTNFFFLIFFFFFFFFFFNFFFFFFFFNKKII